MAKEKKDKKKAHRRYELASGEKVKGATTPIDGQLGWNKRILMYWANREGLEGRDIKEVQRSAMDKGTLAHYLCEMHIKGTEPDKNYIDSYSKEDYDKAENAFLAFLNWEEKNKPEYLGSEVKVVSEKYKYGGTVDILAKHGDDIWLIDLKTGRAKQGGGFYPEHFIQLAAYKCAYEEQTGNKVTECHILRIDKDTGKFECGVFTDLEVAFKVFLCCLELQELQKQL